MILKFQSLTNFWKIILNFNSALVTKEADFLFWRQLRVVSLNTRNWKLLQPDYENLGKHHNASLQSRRWKVNLRDKNSERAHYKGLWEAMPLRCMLEMCRSFLTNWQNLLKLHSCRNRWWQRKFPPRLSGTLQTHFRALSKDKEEPRCTQAVKGRLEPWLIKLKMKGQLSKWHFIKKKQESLGCCTPWLGRSALAHRQFL